MVVKEEDLDKLYQNKYGARCGNPIDMLFSDCGSNQTYRSKTIQNEIFGVCGKVITETLVNEIKDAKFSLFWLMKLLIVLTWNKWRLF